MNMEAAPRRDRLQVLDRAPAPSVGYRFVLRCFNVKYSPNLGDGLLSECLEEALIDLGAGEATNSIDLAARTAYGQAMAGRGTAMKLLHALPAPLRRAAVRLPLALHAARKWRPHYAAGLEGADGVVIGGGNLVSDIDLNFPTKLPLAIEEAERRKLPVAIYACGVGSEWSAAGLKRCREAFSRPHLRAVFVRDEDSKATWDSLMAAETGHVARVVRDPGLLASETYPTLPRDRIRTGRPVAGLGIISPIAIRYHSEKAPSARHLDLWFLDAARGLIAEGFDVRVFTNGSPEDVAYAASLRNRLAALGSEREIAFLDQRDPRGLCGHISRFDVLLAHRMHAVIAAYSYGVPAIALAWDRKLRAFMASVGRETDLVDVAATDAATCVARAGRAVENPVPEHERRAVIAEARADVAMLWDLFKQGEER